MKIEKRLIKDLIPAEYNPRQATKEQEKHLRESLKRFGVVETIVVNSHKDRKDVVVGGHFRLRELKKLGHKDIDCVIVDLPLEDEKELNIRLNANNGEWNMDLLANNFEIPDLENWGLDLDWGLGEEEPEIVEDEVPELKKESIVKKGDVWILGKHRLCCGDSTLIDDIEDLMDGKKADLMITDLPYGVSYADKNNFLNNLDEGNRIQEEIKNDHIKPEELYEFAKNIYTTAYTIMSTKNSYYAFMPQGGEQMMMMMALKDSGFQVKHELIWLKNNHVLGRADYNYKHEPICYGWTDKGTHEFYAKDFKVSILEFDKPSSSKLHPTMKPIALLAELINNSSKIDHIIYDPTGGSGSTLIACEQTNRKCFMMEVDEHYCTVILDRYINLKKNNGDDVYLLKDGKKMPYKGVIDAN